MNSWSTAAITVGQVVCFDYTADADGVGVTQPTTVLLPLLAGVVAEASIASGEYGLIQVYGHNADALVDGTTGLIVGDNLVPANGVFAFVRNGTDYTGGNMAIAGELYSTGAAAAKIVFLRCM